MTTTAIFAELLVTGLQAIVWLVLASLSVAGLTWIDVGTVATRFKDWASLISVFVLGFAYALGIIVDRVADSLFYPMDKGLRDRQVVANLPSVANMRLYVSAEKEGLARFLDYERSRLRLARSTCFNLFFITITATVLLTRSSAGNMEIIAVIAGGLVLFLLSMFAWRRISCTYYERLAQGYKLLIKPDFSPQ